MRFPSVLSRWHLYRIFRVALSQPTLPRTMNINFPLKCRTMCAVLVIETRVVGGSRMIGCGAMKREYCQLGNIAPPILLCLKGVDPMFPTNFLPLRGRRLGSPIQKIPSKPELGRDVYPTMATGVPADAVAQRSRVTEGQALLTQTWCPSIPECPTSPLLCLIRSFSYRQMGPGQ